MTKTRKRIVSFFLVLALVMSMVPAAFAAEIETDPEQTEETTTLPPETTEASTEPEETESPDPSAPPTETEAPEEPTNAEGQPAGDIPIMDGLSMGDVPMPLAMSGTDTGILLFNYADNGNYTTVLNSQISVTYKPNGTGSTKTAYIKNMGWHFARYNNTPYPDNPLYCIEPFRDFAASTSGNKVDRDVTLDGSGTTQGSNVWYALPQARREAIGLVLLYSDQMWNHSISVTNTSKANNPNVPLRIATQMLIYEIVCGMREDGTFNRLSQNESGTSGAVFYNAGNASVTGFAANYNSLVSSVQNAMKIPSFTSKSSSSAPTISMTGDTTTVTDSNGVLADWSFSNGNGVSFSKSGNRLTITKTGNISSSTVMKATRSVPSAANTTYNLWYMSGSSYQTTVSLYKASTSTANAYFKIDPPVDPVGTLSIKKTTEDGKNLSGWQFALYIDAGCTSKYSGPHTTNSTGALTIANLKAGTYYVKETGNTNASISTQYYCASVNPQKVVITSGGTASLSFTNKLNHGSLKIVKYTNTGKNLDGWKIGIYTDSACTKAISGSPFTTGTDGTVTVNNLMPGTYYAKEVASADPFWECDTSVKAVTVAANQTASVSFNNAHYGSIEFRKTTNTGNHLEGWTFTVSNEAGKIIGEFTTDATGFAKTGNLEPGKYTVWEKPTDDNYWTVELGFHTVKVEAGSTAVDNWKNTENGKATFRKSTNTGKDLEGWEIGIYSDEACTKLVTSITTNAEGQCGTYIEPGTYYAMEIADANERWNSGFWQIDKTVHCFEVKPHEEVEMSFNNTHSGRMEILKTVEGGGTLEGWVFKVTDSAGKEIPGSPFTTNKDGKIFAVGLTPGEYHVEEILPENSPYYCTTEQPVSIKVVQGETATARFTNALRPGKLVLTKTDPLENPLAGATFLLEWSEDGTEWKPVTYSTEAVKGSCSTEAVKDGCLTTGADGKLIWDGLQASLKYRLTEISAPDGYNKLTKPAYEGFIPAATMTIEIQVVNTHIFNLPETGSNALRNMALLNAAACIIGITASAYSLKKKREEQ